MFVSQWRTISHTMQLHVTKRMDTSREEREAVSSGGQPVAILGSSGNFGKAARVREHNPLAETRQSETSFALGREEVSMPAVGFVPIGPIREPLPPSDWRRPISLHNTLGASSFTNWTNLNESNHAQTAPAVCPQCLGD